MDLLELYENKFNSLQTMIERGLPSFVYEENPLLVDFLNAYYEWLDQEGSAGETLYNIRSYRDLDTTIATFREYLKNEYIAGIPLQTQADPTIAIKNIKSFYSAKGNEDAIKFLFRLLFDEDIEIVYPKEKILKASDGKWTIKVSLKVTSNVEFQYFNSRIITGKTSGATAIVEDAIRYHEDGLIITELFLSRVQGTFQANELIGATQEGNETNILQERVYDCITTIQVVNGGSGYKIGDKIFIRHDDSNQDVVGQGIVTQLGGAPITGITITNAGSGYKGIYTLATKFLSLPVDYVFNGRNLLETVLDGVDSNDLYYWTLDIDFLLNPAITLLNGTGDPIIVEDENPSSLGNGASGEVSIVDDNGAILAILIKGYGNYYESPIARITSANGSGAVLTVLGGASAIKRARLVSFPAIADSIDNYYAFTLGNNNATFTLGSSALITYNGYWQGDDGRLDTTMKLQDNYYYQDYSYVIRSGNSIDRWSDLLKELAHPAGMKFFGETLIESTDGAIVPTAGESILTTYFAILYNEALAITSDKSVQEIINALMIAVYFYELILDGIDSEVLSDIQTIDLDTPIQDDYGLYQPQHKETIISQS